MSKFDGRKAAEVHRHLHSHLPPDPALRVKALESLVVERGLVARETIDAWVEAYSEHIGPKRGAQVVARAWSDADYKAHLLADAAGAIRVFGFEGDATGDLKAVENSETEHHLVVCTLCSCYPWPVLGLPPSWYKSPEYRARAVREPRAVLEEFGTQVGDDVEIRVWDSSAEIRYLVLPQRPDGTDDFAEEDLVPLVSRDSMIGVRLAGAGEPS